MKAKESGLLDYRTTGLLDYWIAGLLDCWIVGLLDYWMKRHKAADSPLYPDTLSPDT